MTPTNRRRLLIVAAIIGIPLLAREIGVVDLNASRSAANSTISTTRKGPPTNQPLAKEADVVVWPSPFDYLPLYKSRTARGSLSLPAGVPPEQALVRCEWEVTLTVTGLCSARSFRAQIRRKVIDSLNKKPPR